MIIAPMQNKCAEIKIRAERRAGGLLKDGQEKGEINSHGGDRKSKLHDETLIDNKPISLDEAGLSRKESHRFQTLANMPEEIFEKHIQEKIENKEEFYFTFLKGTIYKASRLYPLVFLYSFQPMDFLYICQHLSNDSLSSDFQCK